jgi:hypothetical protein
LHYQLIISLTNETKMKKTLLLTAGLLFSLFAKNNLFAQDANASGFNDVKGVNLLNAGVGLGSYGLSGTGGLPLTASFEHGFSKNISAGASLGFIQKKYAFDWKYTYLLFGARGSYHLNEAVKVANPKLDVYAGAGLFYRRYSFTYTDGAFEDSEYELDASGGDLDFELHAGGRYMFNKGVGAFAELGYGISPLQVGVTLKF